MIFFIVSKVDIAGLNIANKLVETFGFKEDDGKYLGNPVYTKELRGSEEAKIVFVNEEPVNTQNIPYPKDLRIAIFISRHSSKSGTPTLSVHTPGNISNAVLGGLPRKVSISPASAMKAALLEMKKAQEDLNLKYEVSYECTHHGPSIDAPAMFVELGSSLKQWRDLKAAEAVARGAMAAAENEVVYPTVLGIGGQHYNEKFTRLALSSEVAFGHMIPKYALRGVDDYILKHCIERTVEKIDKIVLDWKGMKGDDKRKLLETLKKIDLKIEKV